MEYDLRKDIDRFKHFLDVLEVNLQKQGITDLNLMEMFDKFYDQSEVDVANLKLNRDLTSLDSSLTTLKTNLIAFNQSLLDFNGDTETLASDLSLLSNNLDDFLTEIGSFKSSLLTFDAQLNGGTVGNTTYTGFTTYLDTLETYMYGKGGYDANNQPYTYTNASSDSLKGLLNHLYGELSNLSAGDTQLAITLGALKSKMSAFRGTLDDFDDRLQETLDPEVYSALNTDLVALIYEIASSNDAIDTHQGLIDGVQQLIGTDTDSYNDGDNTVYGLLNDTSQTADDASQSAEDLTKTLYSGTNGTGTTGSPANGTLLKDLRTVEGKATGLENQIGDTNTSGTILYDINQTQSDIGDMSQLTGTLADNVDSALSDISDVQGDISDVQTDIGTVDVDANDDLQTQISTLIGLFKGMLPLVAEVEYLSDVAGRNTIRGNPKVLYGNYLYDIIHDNDTNKYYRREYLDTSGVLGYYGEWVEISSPYISQFISTKLFQAVDYYFRHKDSMVGADEVLDLTSGFVDPLIDGTDNCTQELINNRTYSAIQSASSWTELSGVSDGIAYVNPTLHMVEYFFYKTNCSIGSTSSTLSSGAIPSSYRPKGILFSGAYRPDIVLSLNDNGDVQVRGGSSTNLSGITLHGHFIYSY